MTRYKVYVLPSAAKEIDRLPGHIRQRVRQAVKELARDVYPPRSKRLDYELKSGWELGRLRLESWRLVYVIDREWDRVFVLTVRRRPPYQYDDLDQLLSDVE